MAHVKQVDKPKNKSIFKKWWVWTIIIIVAIVIISASGGDNEEPIEVVSEIAGGLSNIEVAREEAKGIQKQETTAQLEARLAPKNIKNQYKKATADANAKLLENYNEIELAADVAALRESIARNPADEESLREMNLATTAELDRLEEQEAMHIKIQRYAMQMTGYTPEMGTPQIEQNEDGTVNIIFNAKATAEATAKGPQNIMGFDPSRNPTINPNVLPQDIALDRPGLYQDAGSKAAQDFFEFLNRR